MTVPIPTLAKAPYGSPCNGCGRCCYNEICTLGAVVFGRSRGPCPALQSGEDAKLVCGLIANPMRYDPIGTMRSGAAAMSEAAAFLSGSGEGCDAQLDDEPDNPAFSDKIRRAARNHRAKANAAAAKWGIS